MSDANEILRSAIVTLAERMEEAGKAVEREGNRSYAFGSDTELYRTVLRRLERAIAVLVRDPEIVIDPPKVMARRRRK